MCWVSTIPVRLWPGWLNSNAKGNSTQSAGQSCRATVLSRADRHLLKGQRYPFYMISTRPAVIRTGPPVVGIDSCAQCGR